MYDLCDLSILFLGGPMSLSGVSLNTLRAFEAAARHLNFTRAADELCVTQAAVSHQVKALEDQLGRALFRRTARGLVLTDEGAALMPTVAEAFGRLTRALEAIRVGGPHEVLTVGVVGTFAVGILMERIADFRALHPRIDLRLLTNNNKLDLASENLDFGIQFGDGAWRSVDAVRLMPAPLSPLCSPVIAAQLQRPEDLNKCVLLRSYRTSDWRAWLSTAGVNNMLPRGPMFDASTVMVHAAMLGQGVALAPPSMFRREIEQGRIAQPFSLEVDAGSYWLTRLASKEETAAMAAFRAWLLGVV
jgi:LysR family transcriptional regulator of beta-lactamase